MSKTQGIESWYKNSLCDNCEKTLQTTESNTTEQNQSVLSKFVAKTENEKQEDAIE